MNTMSSRLTFPFLLYGLQILHTHHSLLLFILIILVAVITHRYRTSLQSAHLAFVFQSLGNLLAVLVTIDNIIESNEHLKEVRYCPPSLSLSLPYANSHSVRYSTNTLIITSLCFSPIPSVTTASSL